jgi:hypothetical protein
MARPSHTAMSTLTGTIELVTHWNRGERGSADRVQLRLYATMVAMAMGMVKTGDDMTCLHCGMSFHIPSMGDVDRVNATRGYVAGNVVMVCRLCNETRGFMQQGGSDLGGIARLTADVLAASANVHIPTKRDAQSLRSPWRGTVRQRVGGIHWTRSLSQSPYWQ